MLEQVKAQWRYIAAAVALIVVAVSALAAGVSVLAQGDDGTRQPVTVNAAQGAGEATAENVSPGVAQPEGLPTPRPPMGATYHTVAAGETLGKIAAAYGLTAAAIANANGLSDPNMIRVGQRLIIPAR